MYVYSSHYMVILFIHLEYRPETPPNTPQGARAAAHQNEHDNRNLDSPEHHCIHNNPYPPQIPPLQYNLPIPQAPPLPGNADDPFALPPAPVHFNGHQYQNLHQHLAQQLQNLPALPPVHLQHGRGRGHGQNHAQLPSVSMQIRCFFLGFSLTAMKRYNIIIFQHTLLNSLSWD